MFDGFEKALDGPAFASKAHEINPSVGMSGDDKAQFSLALRAFEPEPGDRQRVGAAL